MREVAGHAEHVTVWVGNLDGKVGRVVGVLHLAPVRVGHGAAIAHGIVGVAHTLPNVIRARHQPVERVVVVARQAERVGHRGLIMHRIVGVADAAVVRVAGVNQQVVGVVAIGRGLPVGVRTLSQVADRVIGVAPGMTQRVHLLG